MWALEGFAGHKVQAEIRVRHYGWETDGSLSPGLGLLVLSIHLYSLLRKAGLATDA